MSHSTGQINHDTSEPNAKAIGWSMLITLVTLLVIVFLCTLYYRGANSGELNTKETSRENLDLKELRNYEQKTLNEVKWIDTQKGRVSLPIENAMDKVVQAYK